MKRMSRVLLFSAASIALSLLYSFGPTGMFATVRKEGTISKETVVAPFTFDIMRRPEEIQRDQEEARRKVLAVFDHDEAATQKVYDRLDQLEDLLFPQNRPGRKRPDTLGMLGLSNRSLEVIRQNPRIIEEIRFSMDRLLDSGVIAVVVAANLDAVRAYEARFHVASVPYLLYDKDFCFVRKRGGETVLPISLISPREAAVDKELNRLQKTINSSEILGSVSEILLNYLTPNVFYNPGETVARREAAAAKVPTTRGRIVQGATVVMRGQSLTLEILDALYSLQWARSNQTVKTTAIWDFLVLGATAVLLMTGIAFLLRSFVPAIYNRNADLFAFLLLLVCGLTLMRGTQTILEALRPGLDCPALCPFFAAQAIAALLWGIPGALVMALGVGLSLVLFLELPASFIIFVLLGSALTAWTCARITRSRDYAFLALIMAFGSAVLYGLGELGQLLSNRDAWAGNVVSAAGGGLISALLVLGVRPFELITGRPTRIGLSALGSLSHPLLAKLSIEAAGTFQHSLNVANMCAAAAEALGDDRALARTAGLYHDIGKMSRPSQYWENQEPANREREAIPESILRSIVLSHVQEGVALASGYRLPDEVAQAILEHHGTNPVLQGPGTVAENALRYPGPKPTQRMSAIVMVADSLEMAVRRSGAQTTAERLSLGNAIVRDLLASGQLDRSPLKMEELPRIIESMVMILRGYKASTLEPSR